MKNKKIILTILKIFILLIIIVGIGLSLYLNKDVRLQDKSTFLYTSQQLLIEKNGAKLLVDFDFPKRVESQNKLTETVWINWNLYKDGKITSGKKRSCIVYNVKRISSYSSFLNRLEGNQNFSMGEFEFSWSYGSGFYIWADPHIAHVQ